MGRGDVSRALLLALLVCVACARSGVPEVKSAADAEASIGKVVRVRGPVQRAKLGDAVEAHGLLIVCLGDRLPDATIGAEVVIEGELDRTEQFQATTGPSGEISQGTAPGTSTWVIRGCKLSR